MTPEGILRDKITEYLKPLFPEDRLKWTVDSYFTLLEENKAIIAAIEEYGKQQWNEAIKLAAENATLIGVNKSKNDEVFHAIRFVDDNNTVYVDAQSILKLLK